MKIIKLFFIVVIFLFAPLSVKAAEFKTGDDVILEKEQTTTGSFFAAGKNITINGQVNGDLMCAGQNVVINGQVNGDVLCAASSFTLNGPIEGSLRLITQTAMLSQPVSGNASILAQNFESVSSFIAAKDISLVAQQARINGTIGRDFQALVQNLNLDGQVRGNSYLRVQNFNYGPNSQIDGDLTFYSSKDLPEKPSLTKGKYQFISASMPGISFDKERLFESFTTILRPLLFVFLLFKFGFFLIIGSILISLFPAFFLSVSRQIQQSWSRALAWGILLQLAAVLAMTLFIITIIGIPLVVSFIPIWLITLFVAKLSVSLFIGQKLASLLKSNLGSLPIVYTYIIGLICYFIINQLLFISWFSSFILTSLGLGGLISQFFLWRKK